MPKDQISELLDQRAEHVKLFADWHRRWRQAYAERYGKEANPLAPLADLDRAALDFTSRDHLPGADGGGNNRG